MSLCAILQLHLSPTAALLEGRYKATFINIKECFVACMRYIELNHARDGMATAPSSYPWSSYCANARTQNNSVMMSHQIYLGREIMHKNGRNPTANCFRACSTRLVFKHIVINTGWVSGNDHLSAKMEKLSNPR